VKPKYSLFIGLTFIIVGAVYYTAPTLGGGHVDFAGLTMFGFLSVAMTLLFYVLLAGSPRGD
jgi:hypothetical protein